MNAYQYFRRSLNAGNYDTRLAAVKERADELGKSNVYDFAQIMQLNATQEWLWTIPDLYSRVIDAAVSKHEAVIAAERWLEPMEFSSKFGLPRAAPAERVAEIRSAANAWITGGFKMDDVFANSLDEDFKENIFNAACTTYVAMDVLEKETFNEWRRVRWVEMAAYDHATRPEALEHLEMMVRLKKKIGLARICLHNLLVPAVHDYDIKGYICPLCT
jgi:hypothetical protein